MQNISSNFGTFEAAVVMIITILLLVVGYYALIPSKPSRIVLLGQSLTGKTILFHRLFSNSIPKTVISTAITKAKITLNSREYELIDTPGHSRYVHLLKTVLPASKILALIDANLNAEYLYDFVASNLKMLRGTSIKVLFTRSGGVSLEKLIETLEAKMNKYRSSVSRNVADQSEDTVQEFLGFDEEDFKFEHLDLKIDFLKFGWGDDIEIIKDLIVQ